MAGIVDSIVNTYTAVRESTSGLLYKFIVAIVLLLIGFILGKLLGRLIYKLLHSFEVNEAFHALAGVTLKIEEIAETFTTYFIYFVTVLVVLQQIGLVSTILHLIAAAIMILIILSTFLGIKDFIPNAVAGFFIQHKKELKVGQKIKIKGMQGTITEITLLETKIETKTGDVIFIPNSVLSKTEVTYVKAGKKEKK